MKIKIDGVNKAVNTTVELAAERLFQESMDGIMANIKFEKDADEDSMYDEFSKNISWNAIRWRREGKFLSFEDMARVAEAAHALLWALYDRPDETDVDFMEW